MGWLQSYTQKRPQLLLFSQGVGVFFLYLYAAIKPLYAAVELLYAAVKPLYAAIKPLYRSQTFAQHPKG